MAVKTCPKCAETKSISEFGKNRTRHDGLQSWCKVCFKTYQKSYQSSYYKDNKARIDTKNLEYHATEEGYWSHRTSRWRQIGITDVDTLDWEELIEAQGGKCFICDKVIDVYTAHRDHDHETGLTRAAVCGIKCNQAMDA